MDIDSEEYFKKIFHENRIKLFEQKFALSLKQHIKQDDFGIVFKEKLKDYYIDDPAFADLIVGMHLCENANPNSTLIQEGWLRLKQWIENNLSERSSLNHEYQLHFCKYVKNFLEHINETRSLDFYPKFVKQDFDLN